MTLAKSLLSLGITQWFALQHVLSIAPIIQDYPAAVDLLDLAAPMFLDAGIWIGTLKFI